MLVHFSLISYRSYTRADYRRAGDLEKSPSYPDYKPLSISGVWAFRGNVALSADFDFSGADESEGIRLLRKTAFSGASFLGDRKYRNLFSLLKHLNVVARPELELDAIKKWHRAARSEAWDVKNPQEYSQSISSLFKYLQEHYTAHLRSLLQARDYPNIKRFIWFPAEVVRTVDLNPGDIVEDGTNQFASRFLIFEAIFERPELFAGQEEVALAYIAIVESSFDKALRGKLLGKAMNLGGLSVCTEYLLAVYDFQSDGFERARSRFTKIASSRSAPSKFRELSRLMLARIVFWEFQRAYGNDTDGAGDDSDNEKKKTAKRRPDPDVRAEYIVKLQKIIDEITTPSFKSDVEHYVSAIEIE